MLSNADISFGLRKSLEVSEQTHDHDYHLDILFQQPELDPLAQ
jgi:hypothetical protein